MQIPGGTVEDTHLLMGVILNKDITHSKMRRHIEKPRIVLLDCNLEYKKGESQTAMEITKEEDFTKALMAEEAAIKQVCHMPCVGLVLRRSISRRCAKRSSYSSLMWFSPRRVYRTWRNTT